MAEMVLMHCHMCPQGEYVKDCQYRKAFHRIGIPIGRDEVKDGECEFCVDNYMLPVLPQGCVDRDNKIRKMCQMYYEKAELADQVKRNVENDQRLFL